LEACGFVLFEERVSLVQELMRKEKKEEASNQPRI